MSGEKRGNFSIEEIGWIEFVPPDREELGSQKACTMVEASVYVGKDTWSLRQLFNKHQIKRYKSESSRLLYILQIDLDRLKTMKVVEPK